MAVRRTSNLFLTLALALAATQARSDEPLSAIDWLSESLVTTVAVPIARDPAVVGAISTEPVASSALPQNVVATPLDQPSLDAIGLLSPAKTGLSADLWGTGKQKDILALLNRQKTDALPALKALLLTVLLSESVPPKDAGTDGALLVGRIDKLLAIGALDQSMALLQATGEIQRPELFRRMFDVALLTGSEDRACRKMMQSPGLSAALPARIFCLAREGDWQTADVTLQTAIALNQITADQASLLARFLDPELAETTDALPAPSPITPLDLRIYEAIGEPISIANLPLAFAHADLSEITGWKSRLDAAERLSRAGVISPNLLLGYYTQQKPAASGGVWDRVRAFQTFEETLAAGDPAAIFDALQKVMQAMEDAELETVFADLFAERLAGVSLPADGADLAIKVQLLSARYEDLTRDKSSPDPRLSFALAVARGTPQSAATPDSMARAIATAWTTTELPPELAQMFTDKRIGELILLAIERISNGVQGQLTDVTVGLAVLRELGMEDVSRRTAIELMLLERRG